jgi:hypothetical protein
VFVGHLALAFAVKRRAPDIPLVWLMAAVTIADLVWPIFVLTGIEHVRISPGATAFAPLVFESYPWSHSLLLLIGWALALAGLAWLGGLPVRAAGWLTGLVLHLHGRQSEGWAGPVALWSLVAVCTVMWAGGPWSPPPTSERALGWFALIGWIVLPWVAVADRRYSTR